MIIQLYLVGFNFLLSNCVVLLQILTNTKYKIRLAIQRALISDTLILLGDISQIWYVKFAIAIISLFSYLQIMLI